MTIKALTGEELEQALPLVWTVFCEYEAVHYPEASKRAFWDAIHSEDYLSTLSAYGAFEDDALAGIIATRNEGSHIALFFVDGKHQNRGIGRKLWNEIIDNTRAKEITVHSSIYAKDIYTKLGFIQTGCLRNDGGIQYIPMVYKNHASIESYPYDTAWQAKARKHQSDFREREMKVPAVPNTSRSGCYGNVVSKEDGAKGVNFYPPFWSGIKRDLNGKTGAILTNVLRSEHIPYNIFFPMRRDLQKTASLFRALTGKDVATVRNILIEFAPAPKEEYLDDLTSFDTYIDYTDSSGAQCGIGIEVKYTEQGYPIGKGEAYKIHDRDSAYYRVTRESGCFDCGGIAETDFIERNFGKHERGNDLRQLWRNHMLGLSMMQHQHGLKDFLSVHLYPTFNEHFNPETSTVLSDYCALLSDRGKQTFLPLTYEALFDEMMKCGMDEINEGWLPYLRRRYII